MSSRKFTVYMTLSSSPFTRTSIHNNIYYFESSEDTAARFEICYTKYIIHLRITYHSSQCEKIEALFKEFKAEINQHFHSNMCRMCRKEYDTTPSILKVLEYIYAHNTFAESAKYNIGMLIHQCRLES